MGMTVGSRFVVLRLHTQATDSTLTSGLPATFVKAAVNMARRPIATTLLHNVLRHVDAHNRVLEQEVRAQSCPNTGFFSAAHP